jgi:hypothetical protein
MFIGLIELILLDKEHFTYELLQPLSFSFLTISSPVTKYVKHQAGHLLQFPSCQDHMDRQIS